MAVFPRLSALRRCPRARRRASILRSVQEAVPAVGDFPSWKKNYPSWKWIISKLEVDQFQLGKCNFPTWKICVGAETG
jgi:hypothetical protein